MRAQADNSNRRSPRRIRRIAAGTTLVGVLFAGSTAIGFASTSGDDGRDGGDVPGAPTDAPAPAPDDSNTGRAEGSVPVVGRSGGTETAPAIGPLDNGRSGVDPAFGPLPIPRESAASASADSAVFDTDSGAAPAPDSSRSGPVARSGSSEPADEDVPGAPSTGTAGNDAPSNDQDG